MVLSIMSLVGVELDPAPFQEGNDEGATSALI